jgi:FixJ family two-component response regulator
VPGEYTLKSNSIFPRVAVDRHRLPAHFFRRKLVKSQPSSNRLRVLVADDDVGCRTCTAILLRGAGFDVTEAQNSCEASAVLAAGSVSLVLSDINMPGNERLDLVRDINTRYPGLPVILFTAFPTADTAIESMNAGVVSYLRKPVRADTLLEAVQRAVGLFETRRVVGRSLEHLRGWTEDLARLERQMHNARDASHSEAVGTFLDVSLRRLIASIADIREVVEVLTLSPGGAAGMRTHELERAVKEAINVLERTKRDFKSKELAELRQRLETLMDPGSPAEPKRAARGD